MMYRKRLLGLFLLVLFCFPLISCANASAAGEAAGQAGNRTANALARLRPLAEKGSANAHDDPGSTYAYGNGLPKDDAMATQGLVRKAGGGDGLVNGDPGHRCSHKDHGSAVASRRERAERSDTPAQLIPRNRNVGGDGRCVPENEARARTWPRLAAAQGNRLAKGVLADYQMNPLAEPAGVRPAPRPAAPPRSPGTDRRSAGVPATGQPSATLNQVAMGLVVFEMSTRMCMETHPDLRPQLKYAYAHWNQVNGPLLQKIRALPRYTMFKRLETRVFRASTKNQGPSKADLSRTACENDIRLLNDPRWSAQLRAALSRKPSGRPGAHATVGAEANPKPTAGGSGVKAGNGVATEVARLHEDRNIWGLAISPDGRLLAVGNAGNMTIDVWDWRAKRIVRTLKRARHAALATEPLRFSPDGRLLALCVDARGRVVIRVWDTETGAVVHDLTAPLGSTDCQSIAFSPDGKRLFAAIYELAKAAGDSIVAYSTRTWQPVWGIRTDPSLNTLAVTPNGQFLAAGGLAYVAPDAQHPNGALQTRIVIVDIARRAIVRTFAAFPIGTPGYIPDLSQLVWSPDGVHLATGLGMANPGSDAVRIFNARTGALVTRETTSAETDIYGLRYTPNGKYLIESTRCGHVLIWDGQHQHLLQEIPGDANSLAVSSNSRYLAVSRDCRYVTYSRNRRVLVGPGDKVAVWELK